ncbi:hypothetical protein LSPH24S_00940 [Lysinibacillus sphaericus]
MRIEIRENQVLLDGYVNAVERESRILPKENQLNWLNMREKTKQNQMLFRLLHLFYPL